MRANANLGALNLGMLTDSRSFILPASRIFRRIPAPFGKLNEGSFPENYDILGKIVQDICFNNIAEF